MRGVWSASRSNRCPHASQIAGLPGLGLRHARLLDHLLSGKDLDDDAAFQKLLSARDSSILAHGTNLIGNRAAEKFLKYLDTLVTVP